MGRYGVRGGSQIKKPTKKPSLMNYKKSDGGSNPWKTIWRSGMLLAFSLAMAGPPATAQTYAPLRYWTFDGPNALADSMGNFNLNTSYYGSPYAINTNAAGTGVGKHLTLDPSSSL